MASSKHPQSGREPDPLPADDLDCDPGIGSSRGMSGADEDDADLVAGEHTVEGDVANDTVRGGGIDPEERGRTNP